MARSPEISVAFSTLSASPTRAQEVMRKRRATAAIGERTVQLARQAETIFDRGNVRASLHLARNVDTQRLADHLRNNNVQISDIDVPEVKHMPIAIIQAVGSVFRGNISRAKSHIGWAISNVGSERKLREKIVEGLEATADNPLQVVRIQAADLFTRRGKRIVTLIENYSRQKKKTVALAVEISANIQTPTQYLNFIKEKQQEFKEKGLQICMDIDLGHIARTGEIPHEFLEKVMSDNDLRGIVKFVTFNQHVTGEIEAHARLDTKGQVNFERAAKIIKQFTTVGEHRTILFETDPRDYDWVVADNGGMQEFRQIKTSIT
jgi:hypothetical protein